MNVMRNLTLTVILTSVAFTAVGCNSGPRRIDPTGSEAVTTMGVDYAEVLEWSSTLTNRMINSAFLDTGEFGEQPIRMVVSTIENRTDISNFPTDSMLGRIRASLRSSGKIRMVSTYGDDARDAMPGQTQQLENDPNFENPEWREQGSFSVARLSLRTRILYIGAAEGRDRQKTYEVRMWVTDNRNGEVVWEGFSDPISKVGRRAAVGW